LAAGLLSRLEGLETQSFDQVPGAQVNTPILTPLGPFTNTPQLTLLA